MKYLENCNQRFAQMMTELEQMVEKEVTAALLKELAPHLRNREIVFEESMGSTTCEIKLRDGRWLIITDGDYWVKNNGNGITWEPRWLKFKEWYQKIQTIIEEYREIADNNFAIRVEVTL